MSKNCGLKIINVFRGTAKWCHCRVKLALVEQPVGQSVVWQNKSLKYSIAERQAIHVIHFSQRMQKPLYFHV